MNHLDVIHIKYRIGRMGLDLVSLLNHIYIHIYIYIYIYMELVSERCIIS